MAESTYNIPSQKTTQIVYFLPFYLPTFLSSSFNSVLFLKCIKINISELKFYERNFLHRDLRSDTLISSFVKFDKGNTNIYYMYMEFYVRLKPFATRIRS